MKVDQKVLEDELVKEALEHPERRARLLKELENQLYEYKAATPEEFFSSYNYVGAAVHEIYPIVKEDLVELLNGWLRDKYSEAVFREGLGSGKSMKGNLALMYITHHLLCLRQPQSYYGLMPGSPMVMIVMSLRAMQARLVSYDTMRALIENSPWFKNYFPPDPRVSTMMKFKKEIFVMAGNSRENFPIGFNLFASTLDEAAHFIERSLTGDTEDQARNVYQVLLERNDSRFHGKGLTIMMSSPRSESDFIEHKLREPNPRIFKRIRTTWEAQPAEKFCGTKFYFDLETMSVVSKSGPSTLEIPIEFKAEFMRNPERACRSLAAIPMRSSDVFVKDTSKINVWKDRKGPITPEGWIRKDFQPTSAMYIIHVDLGVSNCAAAVCMGHQEKDITVIDLVHWWNPSSVRDVDFNEIRELIIELKGKGFDIGLVSYDRFQSIDSRQQLERKGISTTEFSVERTLEPYESFKEALYTGKFDIYDVPKFRLEAAEVILKDGRKIVRPPRGSKDVLDCVVSVTAQLRQQEVPILKTGMVV